MATFRSWVSASRLRTLPLAASSTLAGSFMAVADRVYNISIIIWALVTTLLLQILSNMANDLGDSLKGTDNEHRLGPLRTVQSGNIKVAEMKMAVAVVALITLISGIILIVSSLGIANWKVLLFLALGIASIAAAITYTIGRTAYGYSGFGDLFVFLFFGLTGVLGTYYLNAHQLNADTFLMAISVGFLSTGVLNLNNLRDIDNDRRSNKHTIAVRLGERNAKIYHLLLIVIALTAGIAYTLLNFVSPWQFLYLLTLPLFASQLIAIFRIKEHRRLDPFLRYLALTTFAFVLLFGAGIMISL
ncbi:MAG TPA: 1,4-dihydroxy-2-naphthoate octaprenyltransferase [Bacteroidales bacterium]|nr:1,4-dihydroxy-2-naphthoate octaprenyltransferase [Bacteroidales bacterium]